MGINENATFMDEFKRLDGILRDMYDGSTEGGVTTYLREMEICRFDGRNLVADWSKDYEKLRNLRNMRNGLSHDVPYSSEYVTIHDIHWVEEFKSRLFKAEDPLSVLEKRRKDILQKCKSQKCDNFGFKYEPKEVTPSIYIEPNKTTRRLRFEEDCTQKKSFGWLPIIGIVVAVVAVLLMIVFIKC